MNEFTSKKLGEVLAFSNVGVVVFERGANALRPILNEQYDQTILTFKNHAAQIEALAHELETFSITKPKSEKTGQKLVSMAEMYIGDEWDNSAELMEWLGFFEGAAIVHWKLVQGASLALRNEKLSNLSEEGVRIHTELLHLISSLIKDYASQKAV